MHILDYYSNAGQQSELAELLTLAAQHHPAGLADNFLEKDLWVTEVLRLLFDEQLLGDFSIAFKGGTALSKCWNAIERFSEDIDLSVHWADLAGSQNELAEWTATTASRSQNDKFRKRQSIRLTEWTNALVDRLNKRFEDFGLAGLNAALEAQSNGEKIYIHYPRVTSQDSHYQLDYILLEFGGRNRGRPTVTKSVQPYLNEIDVLDSIEFPSASVQAYRPDYILWEKLTALHQFSTQTNEPNPERLARHWYDVDCLLQKQLTDPLTCSTAMDDVIAMKQQRWAVKGVNYEMIKMGALQLIPNAERIEKIALDHSSAIKGGMFFSTPDSFTTIIDRLRVFQTELNHTLPD
ncbi:MAG: nucleotidyl transferase AbiEii/AbiGii toxin family protein [Pseudomonadales bacterium]